MKSNTKSSITLPAGELDAVLRLKKRLGAKSNVEVIRRALRLLDESTELEALRQSFLEESLRARASTLAELAELDHLAGEGIEDED